MVRLIGVIGGAAVAALLVFRSMKRQILFNRFLRFNKVAEGGLSRAKTDTASNYPCPYEYKGHSDWHTNKGVTWRTFVHLSKKLGYSADPKLFFEMPHSLWLRILKGGYWHPFNLDNCKSPEIAIVIVSWAWGSGVKGAEIRLAKFQRKYLGIVDSNITPFEITDNFNRAKLSNRKLFDMLCDQREADFRAMGQPANLNGWLSRLNRFKKAFRPSIV